ncbi:Hypothetical Protein FCC1311_098112 [Hondaea fermentalgiana]|uniref:Uncharacterized protein n=1 Tax=Hondaea fermentalgiana TaxID=2315210 RepID=A0A2R5GUZ0_9STRA|nr:Hypothetical Protein FCC1311_098112 [Hondaea fermentalgiana]|eukprot:GBG33588.1 Hypothetical Protein FCC1311_098112 [Hondaea fermentalgiana]
MADAVDAVSEICLAEDPDESDPDAAAHSAAAFSDTTGHLARLSELSSMKSSGLRPAFKLKERRPRRRGSPAQQSLETLAERLKAQFILSRKSNDLGLMAEVLSQLASDPNADILRLKINQRLIDESLLFSLLSGNADMTRLLLDSAGASIKGADTIFDESKGDMSSCQCGQHPGILLVTLTRQSAHELVDLALKSGLDPNTSVCDGEAQYMWWGVAMTFRGAKLVKSPVLRVTFAKSTPLIAAVMNNDLRMVRLLLDHGADMSLHNWSAVAQAAQVNDPLHQVLSHFLHQLKDNSPDFRTACAVALKGAASRGHKETVAWIFEQLELREDWGALDATATKRLRKRRNVLASASSHALSQNTARSAVQLHVQRAARRQLITHESSSSSSASSSSSSSAAIPKSLSRTASHDRSVTDKRRHMSDATEIETSCLNASSMREYGARRRSLVRHHLDVECDEVEQSSRVPPPPPHVAPRWAPSAASIEDAASEDLATSTVSRAINILIDEALAPGYVHREAFVRGVEALAQIEKERRGSAMTLEQRVQDLYKIFLNTLEEVDPQSARESALALLEVGVEQFLGLDMPLEGPVRGSAGSSRSLGNLADFESLAADSNEDGDARPGKSGAEFSSSSSSSSSSSQRRRWPWTRVRNGLTRIKRSGSARSHSNKIARRASGDEQAMALGLAAKGGHTLIAKHLLSSARSDLRVLVPSLLTMAARNNRADTFAMLVDFIPSDLPDETVCETLNEAFAIAMAAEAIETVDVIMDSGAAPDVGIFVKVMLQACTDPSYSEDAAEYLVFTMTRTNLQFELEDVKSIVDAIVLCEQPNLYNFATLLDLDDSFRTVISTDHFFTLLETSAKYPTTTQWSDLVVMFIKCVEDHHDYHDIMHKVYTKATEPGSAVHPGVLGTLATRSVHSDTDSNPERWV